MRFNLFLLPMPRSLTQHFFFMKTFSIFVFIVYAATETSGADFPITIQSNIVYGIGATESGSNTIDLVLDLYQPQGSFVDLKPALLCVHGGSFTSLNKSSPDMVQAARYFAAKGWVCFSINYRLAGDNPPAPAWLEIFGNPQLNAAHAAAVDTKRAVRWIQSQVNTYGIHPVKIAGLGHSAGAYCVLMSAISDEDDFANDAGGPIPDQLPTFAGKIKAGVEVSGDDGIQAGDFDAMDAPLMIWHSDADAVVPYFEATSLQQSCDTHQIPHRFFTIPGAAHGASTWTALHNGRGLLDHAHDFLSLFFDARVDIAHTNNQLELSWRSVSNALYDIIKIDIAAPSIPSVLYTNMQASSDQTTRVLPAASPPAFYAIHVKSLP